MIEFWWDHLPLKVRHISSMLALVLADGIYLTAFRGVASTPPLILLLGFFIGLSHFWSGDTFTYSIPAMVLMLVISSFSAALGTWLWLGYVVGDFILFPHLQNPNWLNLDTWIYVRLPLFLSYFLLSFLLVSIPLSTRLLRRLTLPNLEEKLSSLTFAQRTFMTVIAAGLQAIIVSVLVYIWTQSVPTLIRPVYTWQGQQPSVAAIAPIQQKGQILVIIAAICGIIRVVLEYRALINSSVKERLSKFQIAFSQTVAKQKSLPVWLIVPIKAAFSIFMLSGIISSWSDVILLGVPLLLAMFIREGLFVRLDARLVYWICKIPLLIRLIAACVISYLLAGIIVRSMWNSTSTFLPIVISTIVGYAVFSILTLNSHYRTPKEIIAGGGQS
ncbi:hypothetical protein NUACC21_52250 [Scytonema sp. NUACC21]